MGTCSSTCITRRVQVTDVSARLSLLVRVDDDGFEKFPCDVDETMAHEGVEPDAELILELDEDEDNGDEEDDNEE